MITTIPLLPGITLRCFPDNRFKQAYLSVLLLRPMCREEAALNALLPAVLLRGTTQYPDMRQITLHLDDLYGAAASCFVRRIGDYQATGISCGFIEDRFAMEGDRILEPMVDFMRQLLLDPVLEDGAFCADFLQSEQRNLIQAIEAQRNDKRAYANQQLLLHMCSSDTLGIPRLGHPEQVRAITPQTLYRHYRKILKESPIHLFYGGSEPPERIAALLRSVFAGLERTPVTLPATRPFADPSGGDHTEQLDVSQGKLCMGYSTEISAMDPRYAAMKVTNILFGGGMTSKLFMQLREKQSLCYDIGSSYTAKGIVAVSAGIDADKEQLVRQQIQLQLDACCRGDFTQEELTAAQQTLISHLQSIHDSLGAIDGYYTSNSLYGIAVTPEASIAQVQAVTREQVMEAAATLRLHTTYLLRGAC